MAGSHAREMVIDARHITHELSTHHARRKSIRAIVVILPVHFTVDSVAIQVIQATSAIHGGIAPTWHAIVVWCSRAVPGERVSTCKSAILGIGVATVGVACVEVDAGWSQAWGSS